MVYTTLQKYTRHITGSKDNRLELTKFKYKKHCSRIDTFFTGNLRKYSRCKSLAHRASFHRAKCLLYIFLKIFLTASQTPINTPNNNDTKIHYVGRENLHRFEVLVH